ncbi:MAG TPA: glycosyl hydrolase [Candidatus Kapabacteria bacterium]|nr:glycosyl hydrolase [Candidatus Kapabacteria bacterium]
MKFISKLIVLLIFINISSVFSQASKDKKEDKINADLFNNFKLRSIGPAATSGRIGDIAIHPSDPNTWYIAVSSGNVWKTTNAGSSFTPIFDNYGAYSIGCVAIDPNNKFVVWVGTGENNSQRSVGYGDGIYKSVDGGQSFKKMGLDKSEHIAKIIIDPKNSDIIYVAAQGPLWGAGGDRGLYKSTDGGKTWAQSLKISENTGVTDILIDPRDSKVIYAASYQRRRHVWTVIDGGPEATVYKSTDAGATWEKANSGLPGGDLGRIGLAISPQNPDVLYAVIEAPEKGGFFKSTDRGASWSKQNPYYSGSAQYYHELFTDPQEFDNLYAVDTYTRFTSDGGKTWSNVSTRERHVDDHAMWIDPHNNKHMLIGGDGGLYETFDKGSTWRFFENLPVTQFYRIQADNSEPFYYVYGGTQDNNSLGAPARTAHPGGILNQDWNYVVGGDGYEPQIDPVDPNIIYGQWQYGNFVRYDKKSGEMTGVQPQPEKDMEIRWNWDTPLIISPHNHKRLYTAANYVFRSDDQGNTWKRISEDISRQINRDELPVMGKVWGPEAIAKSASTSLYGNAISMAESPVKEGLLYVGTDDGLIQISEDGGLKWTKVSTFAGVPENTYNSDIYPSRHNENVVYASFNNHKNHDFKPYILKSIDKGKTWSSISGNLPENGSVWTIEEDTKNPDILFCGTEFGLFVTLDAGKNWFQMKNNFPTIAVRDLDIQEREDDLVIGTFGRGVYIWDDYSPIREINKDNIDKDAYIFPIKPAAMFLEDNSPSRRNEGETFFRGENLPSVAVITYYLKETVKTKKQIRLEKEKELRDAGKNPPYPTYDQLQLEDEEEASYLLFTIKDKSNKVVRQLTAPATKGINRLNWDMRFASSAAPNSNTKINDWAGFPVVPGEYSVTISLVQDGKAKELTTPVKFICKPLNNVTLPANNKQELANFQDKVMDMYAAIDATNSFISDLYKRIDLTKASIKLTRNNSAGLLESAYKIENELQTLKIRLNGNNSISKRNANQAMSLKDRAEYIVFTMWGSSSSSTETNHQSYNIASQQLTAILNDLKVLYNSQISNLEKEMDKVLSPWTPGRFPIWQE